MISSVEAAKTNVIQYMWRVLEAANLSDEDEARFMQSMTLYFDSQWQELSSGVNARPDTET